ncbi:aminotransferase class IV [Streptomyces triculaminicus]|uniref:Aminotransferase class IV n=1 Tax=Streptomyces triculaminicus TaxID=2816232 RepID=A0A939FKH4_9ACTN|nr:aminotransferase class IV [Streptomyces triculaminicus]MBO0652937.1 aminotransferase class IV [Streptomyces triculaminicus]
MRDLSVPYVEVDGRAVDAGPLLSALMGSYGHMTAMQVREGRVRGLDFHLERLDAATREMFGEGMDGGGVRDSVRRALGGAGVADADVRVYVHAMGGLDAGPTTTVVVRPPLAGPGAPQRLRSVPYVRPLAHLKHVGSFGQVYYLRRVRAEGFDEALLVGPGGEVTEGAITNVGFVEGDTVVWPDAPALDGIAMLVLRRELDRAGVAWRRQPVRLDEVGRFERAFVCNSIGVAAVSQIDEVRFPVDGGLVDEVMRLHAAAGWDAI